MTCNYGWVRYICIPSDIIIITEALLGSVLKIYKYLVYGIGSSIRKFMLLNGVLENTNCSEIHGISLSC
jgi:hypothetical protein